MLRNIIRFHFSTIQPTNRSLYTISKWTTTHSCPASPSCNRCVNNVPRHQQKQQIRGKKDDATNLSALFKPVPIKTNSDDISVGAEITGKLNKADLLKILNKFTQKREIKLLCIENGLDSVYLFCVIVSQSQSIFLFLLYIISLSTATSLLELSSLLHRSGKPTGRFAYNGERHSAGCRTH